LHSMAMKSFKPTGKVNKIDLEFARKYIQSFIKPFDQITRHEAIFGNEKLKELNKQSSNGYGMPKGKKSLIDYEMKTITPKLERMLDEFDYKLRNNELKITDILAIETFKDEMRTEAKADTPRTFRVLPLPVIARTKQFLANLLIQIREDMWENQIAIGFNPYLHAHKMKETFDKMAIVFDVDVKNWDGSVLAQIQQMINDVVLDNYIGTDKDSLGLLLSTLINGFVLIGDHVYQNTHAMPSGSWVTALFNSLINKALSAISYSRACRLKKINPDLEKFKQCVDWAMGDDKACGSTDDLKYLFNAVTFRDSCQELNITVTTGDKRPVVLPYTPREELSFLKRTFKYHPKLNRFVAILNKETIFNTLQWYNSDSDYYNAMQGKILSMAVECYLYSIPTWVTLLHFFQNNVADRYNQFTEQEIIDILNSEDGYRQMLNLLEKDYLD